MKVPLTQLVAEALKRRGEATVSELLADVGRYISVSQAASAGGKRQKRLGRKEPGKNAVTVGRRMVLYNALSDLRRRRARAERVGGGRWRWVGSLPFRPRNVS